MVFENGGDRCLGIARADRGLYLSNLTTDVSNLSGKRSKRWCGQVAVGRYAPVAIRSHRVVVRYTHTRLLYWPLSLLADYPITSRVKPRDVYRAPAESRSLIFSRCGGERRRPEAAGLKWPGLGQFRKTSLALSTLALNSLLRSFVRGPSCFLLGSIPSPLSLSLSRSRFAKRREMTQPGGARNPRGGEERWSAAGIPTANIRSNNPLGESPHRPLPSASPSGCRFVARV